MSANLLARTNGHRRDAFTPPPRRRLIMPAPVNVPAVVDPIIRRTVTLRQSHLDAARKLARDLEGCGWRDVAIDEVLRLALARALERYADDLELLGHDINQQREQEQRDGVGFARRS